MIIYHSHADVWIIVVFITRFVESEIAFVAIQITEKTDEHLCYNCKYYWSFFFAMSPFGETVAGSCILCLMEGAHRRSKYG